MYNVCVSGAVNTAVSGAVVALASGAILVPEKAKKLRVVLRRWKTDASRCRAGLSGDDPGSIVALLPELHNGNGQCRVHEPGGSTSWVDYTAIMRCTDQADMRESEVMDLFDEVQNAGHGDVRLVLRFSGRS